MCACKFGQKFLIISLVVDRSKRLPSILDIAPTSLSHLLAVPLMKKIYYIYEERVRNFGLKTQLKGLKELRDPSVQNNQILLVSLNANPIYQQCRNQLYNIKTVCGIFLISL